nr:probable E3 ubiquitin-protein ligase RHG1A isoform X1 [Tanacetum cinerariifolium]
MKEMICNFFDLMRRGERERVRFEDLMLLDRSIFFGIANIHDRHRDMRLDVDNMPYEYDDREYTRGYMYNEDRLLLPKLKCSLDCHF